jgi:branched-chain amino acid transport system substrate-binding protein
MSEKKKISRRTFLKGAAATGIGSLAWGVGKVGEAQEKKEKAPPKAKPAKKALGVDVIKIGGQGVTSGAHADYGWQMIAGSTLAIEEINAKGGILGSKLELKFMDEELKPAVAVKNARYLATEWGAHFLFGVDSSGSSMAVGPILPEIDRICMFTHASTHRLTEELVYGKGVKQIFRIAAPVYQESNLASLIFKDFPNIKRWAGIQCDYEYGYSVWALFKETLKKYRPDVEFVAIAWAPFWTMDFSSHISAVMAANPDAIHATPWAGEGVMLLRQALMLGVFDKVQAWFQCMGGSVDILEGISNEVAAGKFKDKLWATARYLHNYPESPENKKFVDNFRKRWNRFPNYSAENSYSTIYFFKAAVEKTRSLKTADLIKALEGMELMTPAGKRFFRPEDHQAIYNVPGGRVIKDPNYPIPIVGGDLKVIPAKDYFRTPPFAPIKMDK